jgi:spermidine synthase
MDKKWFRETLYDYDINKIGYSQSFLYQGDVISVNSEYQLIEVFDNPKFGKVLALDGVIQTTENDEYFYHEMFVHVPCFYFNNAKSVLIIGGGDGGILREVVKHKNLEKIVMVEIDSKVFEISKKYIPNLVNDADKDSRVEILFEDGIEFVKKSNEKFDIVIVDSTDPVSVAEGLFTVEFYKDVRSILNEKGIVATQSGVPFFQQQEMINVYEKLKSLFDFCDFFIVPVPTYLVGFMALSFASNFNYIKNVDYNSVNVAIKEKNILNLKYYNVDMHFSCFKLPQYIKNVIY